MIKWGLVYETTDNKSAQFLKQSVMNLFMHGNTRYEHIPGFFVFPRESDKTFVGVFCAIQKISQSPELAGKIKKLRLLRMTDDSDMLPAIDKKAHAPKESKDLHGHYGDMQ